jgi:ubiquinone/menaquinone biosynthesis C-methylase UbiE
MPFDNETLDFIMCTDAFDNFSDLIGALREMYRVLRAKGKAVIIDHRRNASDEALCDYVKKLGEQNDEPDL